VGWTEHNEKITFLKISAAMGTVELTGLEMMAIMASGQT
jgi:hypothetical protein